MIRLSPIRLIDQDKNQIGVIPVDQALRMAREAGLDLVEVSPNERPPVCRIMDYGKHKYEVAKKLKQKHHEQKLKEVRLRPKTDTHDREVKIKHAREFLSHGDRVQFTMLFKGRERAHQDIGREAFDEIVVKLADIAKVDSPARLFGRKMLMVLVPLKLPPLTKPKVKDPEKDKGSAKAVKKTEKPEAKSEARKDSDADTAQASNPQPA